MEKDIKLLKDILNVIYDNKSFSVNHIINDLQIGFNRAKHYLNLLDELKIISLDKKELLVSHDEALEILNKKEGEKGMNYFNNIIGYEHVKKELNVLIDILNNKEKYKKLGVKIPKNLMLSGPAGVGKTLFANTFINSLNRNKYIIRKNKPDGDFVNDINETIKTAISNQPSVVLLDDLDKFSNNDEGHQNSDEFIVVQSFIDECKDKDVYFVATCNNLRTLPHSLLRSGRFSSKIEFNNPTLKDSILIIEHYLSDKNVSKDVDYEEIARILEGGTCALLEAVMNEAGLIAGFNNKDIITMDDIIKASLRVIYDAPENIDNKTELQLKIAAYHEAAHTVVAEVLEPGSVNLVSVANYYGNKGGLTSQTNDDNYWCSYTKMENRVKVLLAGKAATELIFNSIDTGASSDISRARRILARFLDDYGVDNFSSCDNYSADAIKARFEIWEDIKLSDYYREAKTILFNNKDKLDKIAKELINNKTIIRKDINKIMRGE